MKPGDVVVSALAEWNGKALKTAQKDVGVFDKSVKNLAKTFAGVFSASKILSYSKNAVNAFMADERAAKSLEVQLSNLGYSFSAPGVELYIANLEKMYGVLDDQLRPAFQTLITASGSLTQSQKALEVALNVSAATGKSVEEVSAALAKGFSGQTTALSRLGAGLDKATLASGDMNKIMDELSVKFSGQASARLTTYAGKMDLLEASAARASETIGKGILDSLTILGNDKSIDKITSSMEDLAQSISDVSVGFATVLKKLEDIGNSKYFPIMEALGWVFANTSGLGLLAKLGASEREKMNAPTSNFTYSLGTGAAGEIAAAKQAKLDRDKLRVQQQLLAADKAKLALNDLAKKFDTERLGLQLALNNASDEETKLRIKAKIALLDQDAAMAATYNKQLEAAAALNALNAATAKLTLQFGASTNDIQKYLSGQMSSYNQYIATGTTPSKAPDVVTAQVVNDYLAKKADEVTTNTQTYLEKLRNTVKAGYDIPSVESFYGSLDKAASSLPQTNVNNTVEVSVQGSILALQDLDKAIEDAMLRIQRQNGSLTPAGYIP